MTCEFCGGPHPVVHTESGTVCHEACFLQNALCVFAFLWAIDCESARSNGFRQGYAFGYLKAACISGSEQLIAWAEDRWRDCL